MAKMTTAEQQEILKLKREKWALQRARRVERRTEKASERAVRQGGVPSLEDELASMEVPQETWFSRNKKMVLIGSGLIGLLGLYLIVRKKGR